METRRKGNPLVRETQMETTTTAKKSFHILDTHYRDELVALPTKISFIDFETMTNTPSPIPGVQSGQLIPVQFSNHILTRHGLDWKGNIEHDEFLWTGDYGFSPVYAFVRALHKSVAGSETIVIYTSYEIRCLNECAKMIQADIDAYNDGMFDDTYVAVDENGHKVPLMSIAEETLDMVGEILNSNIYDQCRGWCNDGGVTLWLQSPDLNHSNSIKDVLPVAMDEYSGTQELLAYFNEPLDGYAGLRREGHIAKGDECTTKYSAALDRPWRDGVPYDEDGAAPFDPDIEAQCLRYCCLDTLAMVIIYLAVLEATDRFEKGYGSEVSEYVLFHDDGKFHKCIVDGDKKTVQKLDCPSMIYSWGDDMVEVMLNWDVLDMPMGEYFGLASDALVSQFATW